MTGIAVAGLDSAGGKQLGGSQSFAQVEGQSIVVLGDPVQGHGQSPHNSPIMAQGSSWMTLNGIPVCCTGHRASCGHPSSGRPWFNLPEGTA